MANTKLSGLVRIYRRAGVTLRLYDTGQRIDNCKARLSYTLKYRGAVIFSGDQYVLGAGIGPASIDAVRGILAFLTLQPGNTDREYFENYTAAQFEFIETAAAEELRLYLSQFDS